MSVISFSFITEIEYTTSRQDFAAIHTDAWINTNKRGSALIQTVISWCGNSKCHSEVEPQSGTLPPRPVALYRHSLHYGH